MSAAESTSTIELWTSWEGHVINGVYPLRRHLGSSDHSGVFLTESRNATPSDVAIKIVPAVAGHAESQLSAWLIAAAIDHPNIVRIFEAGQCQVDGRPYLYAVMEYADQDLAQLLQRRALTEEETREMLVPTLGALGFLHEKKFVQGRVKPSNVLVVGDQLKLASDTIRRAGEGVDGTHAISAYDPPELREAGRSTAGDIWALGVMMCEALTRRQPLALHGGGNPVFPLDLSHAFRELVAWCLSRRPSDRPEVAELEASLRGERTVPVAILAVEPSAPPAPPAAAIAPTEEPAATLPESASPSAPSPEVNPAPVVLSPAQTLAILAPAPAGASVPMSKPGIQVVVEEFPKPVSESRQPVSVGEKSPSAEEASKPGYAVRAAAFAGVVLIAWFGMKLLSNRSTDAPPDAVEVSAVGAADTSSAASPDTTSSEMADHVETPPDTTRVAAADNAQRAVPVTRLASAAPDTTPSDPSFSATNEVIPDVPSRASRTIRGRVRVSVRVIVEKDGTVFAALADDRGPSRYFERLAIDAAKKWTFVPAETDDQRLMLIRFTFTRQGTTATATALR